MEALGVASSIAGLISLTEVIVFKVSKYCSIVKGARSDIRDLLVEVQNLYGVLTRLKLLASCLEDDEPYYAKSKNIPRLDHFQTCRQNLDLLKKSLAKMELESVKGFAAAKIMLLWPFKVTETKELLEKIMRNKRDLSEALTADGIASLVNALSTTQSRLAEDIANVQRELQRAADEKAENEMDDQKRKIFEWCSKFDPYQKHRNSKDLRHPNTLTWLFDSPEYKKWVEKANSALWLFGIPGAGKTILSSAVIEDAKTIANQRPGHAIAYYYCEHRLKETQMLSNMLGSMIKQICAVSDEAFDEVSLFYAQHNEKGKFPGLPTSEDLGKLLKRLSRHFESVMIVVDGLDECALAEERNAMLAFFSTLHAPDQGNLKAIYASRDEVDIRRSLNEIDKISIAARGTDLELFVAAGIELRISNNSLRLNSALKETIIDGIVSKANGMFQWAKCQLDHLCLLSTDRERRRALDSLPKDLFETYKRILDRVNDSSEGNKSMVERTLRWLCFSPETLNIEALTTLVAIDINSKALHTEDIPDEHSLLWWCSSLVSMDRNGTVSLTHFTVKEFLTNPALLDHPTLRRYHMAKDRSDGILAKVCLTYLSFAQFSRLRVEIDEARAKEIFMEYPILKIAGSIWPAIIGGHDEDEELFDLGCRFLNPRKSQAFLLWLSLLFAQFGNRIPRSTPTLHFAATFGMTKVVEWLILEKGVDVNFNDSHYATPLICAVRGMTNWEEWEGHSEDVNSWTISNGMPNHETVRAILKHGGSRSATTTISKPGLSRGVGNTTKVTPMALALDLVYSNKDLGCRIFKELLVSHAISSFANSSFWAKCERLGSNRLGLDWREDLVELFMETLDHPSANSLDSESREKMLLFVTSYGKPLEETELETFHFGGGDVFSSDDSIEQLVKSAARNGQMHLIEDLISKNVDPTILSSGLSPASIAGFADIVRLLLENCPPKEHPDLESIENGWTDAACLGKVDCLKVFLDYGLDVNMPVKYYLYDKIQMRNDNDEALLGCALGCAVHTGALEAVQFLSTLPEIDFGCKTGGQNLLHLAAQATLDRTEIVELLLAKGLDPLELSDNGRSVLHYLLGNRTYSVKDLELLKILIKLGCSLDVIDLDGNSLLHILLNEGMDHGFHQGDDPDEDFDQDHVFDTVSYLIEQHDTRSIARTHDGLLPLQIAIRRRLPSRFIECLIPEDPKVWNCSGIANYSPLHEAVEPGGLYSRYFDEDASNRMLNILVDRPGLDVSVVDSMGQTPFLLVCDKGYKGAPPARTRLIKKLLEAGSDVNARGDNDWTAIHCLSSSGYIGALSEVLAYKPDLQSLNDLGHSPLHSAIERGNLEVIQLLIDRCGILSEGKDRTKLDMKQKTSDGVVPIHMAARTGNDEIIRLLFEHKQVPDINVRTMSDGRITSLHYAVERNYMSCVRCLIELGADVNSLDAFKATPLHYAAGNGRKDIAILLAENGGDVTAEDSSGCSPWLAAAIKGHEEVKDFLYELSNAATIKKKEESKSNREVMPDNLYLKRKATIEPDSAQLRADALSNALERHDMSVCRALIDSRGKPDEPLDRYERTALHIAAGTPWSEGVQMLLEVGASPHIKDIYGNTPLHAAAIPGLELNIEILISNGADLQARNDNMDTPLHLAARDGNYEAVRKILTWHALEKTPEADPKNPESQPESLDNGGATLPSANEEQRPLWLRRDPALHSKYVDALDIERKTPLMMAIEGKWIDTSMLLLEEGANFRIKDVFGRDSFWQSGYCVNKPLIRKMLSQGADVNISDYLGFTFLHNAASRTFSDDKIGYTVMQIMLEEGAKLHSNNRVRVSPLHCAASYGNQRLVKELLDLMPKEELDVESSYFGTPLYAAAFRGWTSVAKYLIHKGARMDIGLNGETPLDAARNGAHKELEIFFMMHLAEQEGKNIPRSRRQQRLLEFKPHGQEAEVIGCMSTKTNDTASLSRERLKELKDNPRLYHPYAPLDPRWDDL